jgi:hypothetical protein
MAIWLVIVLLAEFILMVLVGLRAGTLLDREKKSVNKSKINGSPNSHENDEEQGNKPMPPVECQNSNPTNGKANQPTAAKICDAFPKFIVCCVHKMKP